LVSVDVGHRYACAWRDSIQVQERATGYGRYGYGYDYGAKGRLKKTEIVMIPQRSDQDQDASLARADG